MGLALLMCERCDAPQGSLDDKLDWRLSRNKEATMGKENLPLGEGGYWIGILGLVILLGVIFLKAVGL
ncbi:hypothetical protein UFOVP529_80 [uncultured Caudovirales phage]|uniref:Uncharacterized protein n=1 Tax=uncultured Caudovirales phage TaxID=2100421 RepID=A0A6J5MS96_9CAUD|nr:hypothetical protein UFOVP529_80 [uncultured Caudovirales phage]CAB4189842.1 hypothetical protein UFOVP1191_18 [uncultured Caudovirales phage]CAB4194399.1 hypothetical protein UFOVP1252_41 [uncultured Caudovirales phage]